MIAFPAPRSALYLPASNPRAIEKARGLAADMILLDLEDAVKPENKEAARAAAVAAARAKAFSCSMAVAIRSANLKEFCDRSLPVRHASDSFRERLIADCFHIVNKC